MTARRRTIISQSASIAAVLVLVTWWSYSVHPPIWVGLTLGPVAGLVAVLIGAMVGGFWNGRHRPVRDAGNQRQGER